MLLDDQQTQLAADGDEVLVRRVMGGTDGITAHILHDAELAVHGIVVSGGAGSALIVVQANTVELDVHTVQGKAGAGEGKPAEAELAFTGIHNITAHNNFRLDGVQVGALDGPQLGVGNHGSAGSGNGAAGGDADGAFCGGQSGIAALFVNRVAHGGGNFGLAVVDHIHFHIDCADVGSNVGSGDLGAVEIHMDGIQHQQSHIPVDAGAGVPAGRGKLVDSLDRDDIFSNTVADQLLRDVNSKIAVSIVMLAYEGAVDIDIGMHIHTVEVQQEGLSGLFSGDGEALAVPAGAAGQEAGLGFAGAGEMLGDAEIVGQIHIIPAGIGEILVGCGAVISQVKFPALIQVIFPGIELLAHIDSLFRTPDGAGAGSFDASKRNHGNHQNQCQQDCTVLPGTPSTHKDTV